MSKIFGNIKNFENSALKQTKWWYHGKKQKIWWTLISLMTTVYCALCRPSQIFLVKIYKLHSEVWAKPWTDTKFWPKNTLQPYCVVFNFNAHLFTPHQISDKSSPENSQRLIVEVRWVVPSDLVHQNLPLLNVRLQVPNLLDSPPMSHVLGGH